MTNRGDVILLSGYDTPYFIGEQVAFTLSTQANILITHRIISGHYDK